MSIAALDLANISMIYRAAMPRKFRPSKLTADQRADAARLAAALVKASKSQADLAKHLGITPGAVGHWINGQRAINEDRLVETAAFLKVRPEDLSPSIAVALSRKLALSKSPGRRHISGSRGELVEAQNPPIKAKVRGIATMNQSGAWQWAEMLPSEGSIEWSRPGCYALRVMGDAMHPRYKSGDYIIVREDQAPEPDCDVLVVLKDGSAMIRELASVREGNVALRGLSGARQTIEQAKIQFMHRIVGRSDVSEIVA